MGDWEVCKFLRNFWLAALMHPHPGEARTKVRGSASTSKAIRSNIGLVFLFWEQPQSVSCSRALGGDPCVTLQPPEMRDPGRELGRLHRPLESSRVGSQPCVWKWCEKKASEKHPERGSGWGFSCKEQRKESSRSLSAFPACVAADPG